MDKTRHARVTRKLTLEYCVTRQGTQAITCQWNQAKFDLRERRNSSPRVSKRIHYDTTLLGKYYVRRISDPSVKCEFLRCQQRRSSFYVFWEPQMALMEVGSSFDFKVVAISLEMIAVTLFRA